YTGGFEIAVVQRRRKYMLFRIENGSVERVLISHFGMAAAFFVLQSLDGLPIPLFRKHW
ncbi:DNA-formamidopyrimidine glycosylase, partial [Staphylococcus pseudintermedius]